MGSDIEVGGMIQRKKQGEESKSKHNVIHKNSPKITKVSESQKKRQTTSRLTARWKTLLATMVLALAVVGLMYQLLSKLVFLRIMTMIPVALSFVAGLRKDQLIHQRVVPLALVATVLAAQLPPFLAKAIAATAVVFFGVQTKPDPAIDSASRKKPKDATGFKSILMAVLVVVSVLLTENFLIWVVSATFEPGQTVETAPPPLQDNGKIFMNRIFSNLSKKQVVGLRRIWNTQWALVACFASSLAIVDMYHPGRALYTLGTRVVLTVAAARFIRTVSFLLTVVPSQVTNCYAQRFPYPPPTDMYEWIWVGLVPRSNGGCNDLIISGHATVTSALACVSTSVAEDPFFSVAMWSMVALDYAVEVYEGFHYSVDMWLGMVLVALLWHVLQPIEGVTISLGNVSDLSQAEGSVSLRNVALYLPPAVLAYLQLVALPQSTANFMIMSYVVAILVVIFKGVRGDCEESKQQFLMHYCQHMLLCLLFMTFGIYL